ncbi:M48 family metallopeptidase [Pseudorhodobacter turbinis]|uniref:M48 family metallopeptidase n=1 Tax=Pseudorhodobacter turbinis TaxID=2500533 RepID=A0A4V1E117_9RHOB|nr:SprT family zinc-dependent metalloprotease [Pseudorhodobacter turbinis]QCO56574.1 M48 family metallopeptidase [Pseudorhodobacter turbinis]
MPVLPGPPPVEVTLRRTARARRMSLRVSRLDGRVTLSLPPVVREAEAMAFLRAQEDWIRKALLNVVQSGAVALGDEIPVEGRLVRLMPGQGRNLVLTQDTLLVPGQAERVGARVAAYLKTKARDRLAAASDHYAGRIGRQYRTLTLRDTRSRWGSCTSEAGLMYSWRLIMAPPQVLDYVAAHEVAHLIEMNHSPRFWAIVDDLMPDYAVHRRWLKSEGHALHSYRFAG